MMSKIYLINVKLVHVYLDLIYSKSYYILISGYLLLIYSSKAYNFLELNILVPNEAGVHFPFERHKEQNYS